ncbi:UNKNOWN [Stylonychia lemnae]|uniref:Uncharacterized protein n=1 Tax=Stylonychia lemnae TaxID=5949 RepID=A0A078AQD2_STYLE|nr:UNKNOWN [Stylonychia lemnae]|eukprot:CDW84625.1 UNKNOWN [Stylonychia lemnae]
MNSMQLKRASLQKLDQSTIKLNEILQNQEKYLQLSKSPGEISFLNESLVLQTKNGNDIRYDAQEQLKFSKLDSQNVKSTRSAQIVSSKKQSKSAMQKRKPKDKKLIDKEQIQNSDQLEAYTNQTFLKKVSSQVPLKQQETNRSKQFNDVLSFKDKEDSDRQSAIDFDIYVQKQSIIEEQLDAELQKSINAKSKGI